MEPVDPEEAPDYYNVVKEPMGKFPRFIVHVNIFCIIVSIIRY